MSARPASDSATPFMSVNFCDPRQQESAVPAAVRIDDGFDVPEERMCVLDLVDDHRLRVARQKGCGILVRLFGLGWQIERHEMVAGEQSSQCGGLARLPGAGQHEHRARRTRRSMSRPIHMR